MIVDYEVPMKKLSEDFVPHSKVIHLMIFIIKSNILKYIKIYIFKLIYEALQSLSSIYKQKNLTAEELRRNLILNLSGSPNLMLQPPFTDTVFIFF